LWFDLAFDRRGRWIEIYVFPFFFWWDEYFAVYDFSHLGLERICGVGFGCYEVVGLYELFYFVFIEVCR